MESAHYRDVEVKYVHSGLMAHNRYLLTMICCLSNYRCSFNNKYGTGLFHRSNNIKNLMPQRKIIVKKNNL